MCCERRSVYFGSYRKGTLAAVVNGIPFVVVRAISDKADGSAEVDYPTFENEAAVHCANMVLEFVKSFQ